MTTREWLVSALKSPRTTERVTTAKSKCSRITSHVIYILRFLIVSQDWITVIFFIFITSQMKCITLFMEQTLASSHLKWHKLVGKIVIYTRYIANILKVQCHLQAVFSTLVLTFTKRILRKRESVYLASLLICMNRKMRVILDAGGEIESVYMLSTQNTTQISPDSVMYRY